MSTSTSLVTVIINNYNYDRFLSKAIESILIILLSRLWSSTMGSTDNSSEIIARYAGPCSRRKSLV